jgi:hypothetical protein
LIKKIRKEDFGIDSINFSNYIYGNKGSFEGFTMTLGIPGDDYYGYMEFIIKYTPEGWPKGMELMFN